MVVMQEEAIHVCVKCYFETIRWFAWCNPLEVPLILEWVLVPGSVLWGRVGRSVLKGGQVSVEGWAGQCCR